MNKLLTILSLAAILSSCAGTIEGIRADLNANIGSSTVADPVILEIQKAIDELKSLNDKL